MAEGKKVAHCHKDLAKVAKECCAATYDELMSQNLLYEAWKKKNPDLAKQPRQLKARFVQRKWGMFIEGARATLAAMLQQPIDEQAKERIMDILILDSTLIRGRVNPATLAGAVRNN